MADVAVQGTTLYYDERGEGQPLLLLHGMCGDASVWSDQMQRLAPRFRCIAYDRRGHSRSPLGEGVTRTVQLHADDAAQLITALGLGPCVLVGSSGGARIAFDVVRRYPSLVAGAVLSEPPIFALDPPGAAEFIGQLKPAMDAAIAQVGPRGGVDAFFEIVCPGLWRALPEARRDAPYRDNVAELFGDLGMPLYAVTPADLARIDRPCLVMRGSESGAVFRRIVGTLAQHIPGAQLVELAGSGHVTYFERPAEFAAATGAFADRLGVAYGAG